jgi:hypothetical protein
MATKTTTTERLARKKAAPPAPSPQPDWQSPRVAQPVEAITAPEAKLNVLQQAQAVVGLNADPAVLAAVILAQTADRFATKLIEAAAISQYHRGS